MNARKKLIIPFLLPSMALVAVFFILPALQTIVLSLQDWDGTFRTTGFKGLENYFRLFQDQLFLDAVGHTFAYYHATSVSYRTFPCCRTAENKALQNVYPVLYFYAGYAICCRCSCPMEMVYL